MTQEKILEYLQAELEWNMRQKPSRDCCSDDEEDTERFIDNFINGIRWTD